MSETRRNVFKTSILSIFGLLSGAAVIRAAAQPPSGPDLYSADVHVYTTSEKYPNQWILFRQVPNDPTTYNAWFFTPVPQSGSNARMEWDSGVIAGGSTTPITDPDLNVTIVGCTGQNTLDIINGQISTKRLFGTDAKQFTWNEIGDQRQLTALGGAQPNPARH